MEQVWRKRKSHLREVAFSMIEWLDAYLRSALAAL